MADSIVGMFAETVARVPNQPAARFRDSDGSWKTRTWTEVDRDRMVVAAGLLSLGIEVGERINILSNTSYRWVLADLAIQTCGSAPVAIYQSNLPHECRYIIDDCDAVLVFAEDQDQLSKLIEIRDEIPKVRRVIVMDDSCEDGEWTLRWSTLVETGEAELEQHQEALRTRSDALKPDDLLTLIYTSGTTGPPKGVILTHSNMLYEAESMQRIEGMLSEREVQYLFLPLAHSFAKVLECAWIATGHEVAIDSDVQRIMPNLAVIRPTVMCSVPRIFEKVFTKVTSQGLAAPGLKGQLFKWALGLNQRYAQHMQDGTPVPVMLGLQMKAARALVFSKVGAKLSELFGGRLRYFISGGAPLSKQIAYFFANSGVTILEGYGLTETSAATTVNRLEKNKIGTVGAPLEGTEIKIAGDGEIMIRGPGVMKGYWKKDEATKAVLAADGWFATGDIGVIDADGYVSITDRKKDIIVTAGGKNVAPQNIENTLKAASPLISQVMVYGDKRKYLSALVTLEPEALQAFAAPRGINGGYASMSQAPAVEKAVGEVIAGVNGSLASYETIKRFRVLDADFEVGDELTPTLKVKRKHATEKYQELLDGMYDQAVID